MITKKINASGAISRVSTIREKCPGVNSDALGFSFINPQDTVSFKSEYPKEENPSTQRDYLMNLIGKLDKKEKDIILNLLCGGEFTQKELLAMLEQDKNWKERIGSTKSAQNNLYKISDLSEDARKAFVEYVQANNLSKTDVKAVLSNDENLRDIEKMIFEYFAQEREEVMDLCLNTWVESRKAQESRLKTLGALQDELNKIDAEIWSHRCKTNQDISDLYYKTLFGS